MSRVLWPLFFLLLLSTNVKPQQISGSRIQHFDLKDGLSFGIVNSICQDNHGFLWFSTSDGLNRFDGSTFKVFKSKKGDDNSLSSSFIESIFKDKNGTLWVSSRDGLNQYDGKNDRFIKHKIVIKAAGSVSNDITDISQASDGNLWVATSDGFYHFDVHTKIFSRNSTAAGNGISDTPVLNIFEDSHGILWVGTIDNGFFAYKTHKGKLLSRLKFAQSIPKARVYNVYEDESRSIWVTTSKGLLRFDRERNLFDNINGLGYGLNTNVFLSIVQLASNEYLVGIEDGGLKRLRVLGAKGSLRYQFETVKTESGAPLTSRSVQTLYRDKDHNVWVGTYGTGVYLISSDNQKFRKYQQKLTDESYVRYYGMCMDDDGNLWLGTDGNGIYKSNLEGAVLKHYTAQSTAGSLKDNAILSAFKDSRGRLWFGTYQKGLFLYNKSSDSFSSYSNKPDDASSLGSNDVRVIFEDSRKQIWVGSNGGGLSLLDEKTGRFLNLKINNSEISSNDVRAIIEDPKGNLWVGSYGGGGLNYFDAKMKRFVSFVGQRGLENAISNHVVFALHLDTKGRLWIGTEGDGLISYNTRTGQTQVFDEHKGLANNTVNAIRAENDQVLWLSTNKGLSKLEIPGLRITNYDGNDGLQLGQFHEGSAIYDQRRGIMVFGGTEGWNIFKPAEIKRSKYHPKVLITELKLYGQPDDETKSPGMLDITESGRVELTPDQSVFSINYVLLDYAFPNEGEFAYKLEGLDDSWNYVKNQRSATYRYLNPGTYTFKVKAANHDGVWSDHYASITVKILPPWYKTWWAYLIYLISLSAAIYSFIRYRTEQARLKYEVKTAHFEAEKEKELHKKKVDFFTNISHEFRTPLTLIINPLKEMLYDEKKELNVGALNTVHRNARRLLSLVDQLLLFRKSESENDKLKVTRLNLVDICKEVFLCFSHQAKLQKVELVFNTSVEELEIYADREKIEIVLFNLMSNALKYTPQNGTVSLDIGQDEGQAIIKVSDTGLGIPEHVGERLFDQFYQVSDINSPFKGGFGIGLFLVKTYLESHRGNVSYDSESGKGTTFTISLLKGKDHFKPNAIFEEVTEASIFLEELVEEIQQPSQLPEKPEGDAALDLYTEVKTILIVDDNAQIRQYVKQLFSAQFEVIESDNGVEGFELLKKHMPDVVISDIMMQGLSGIELCSRVKEDPALTHIPVILLTASTSLEIKLKGIECGADDFISKPFEKEILIARVTGILKSRNNLQNYFYNQITLQPNQSKISAEYKEFLEKSIRIVEQHFGDEQFGIKTLSEELGMSRSKLHTRIKSVSGQSASSFIRSIRLRKAAEIFITTDCTVSETAYQVGIKDIKYFREQFNALFGMNPSDYIKKYRQQFNSSHSIKREVNVRKVK